MAQLLPADTAPDTAPQPRCRVSQPNWDEQQPPARDNPAQLLLLPILSYCRQRSTVEVLPPEFDLDISDMKEMTTIAGRAVECVAAGDICHYRAGCVCGAVRPDNGDNGDCVRTVAAQHSSSCYAGGTRARPPTAAPPEPAITVSNTTHFSPLAATNHRPSGQFLYCLLVQFTLP